MKKGLLSLIAVGVMGCSYSVNTEVLHQPALFWDGVKPALKDKYNPEGEHCIRRVYVGKHSVAVTYHCKGKNHLSFVSEEHIDTDDDGKVNKACFADLYSFPDSTVKKETDCIELRNKKSLSDVANDWLTR